MNTIKATMTTAAIATMETVDTATTTHDSFPVPCARETLGDAVERGAESGAGRVGTTLAH